MNWDAIGAIAELLGAVGVIASLIYLATQIRQSRDQMERNTRATQAASNQQWDDSLQGTVMEGVNLIPAMDSLVRLGLADFEQLGDEDSFRFTFWMSSLMRRYDAAYYQPEPGRVEGWRGGPRGHGLVCIPGFPVRARVGPTVTPFPAPATSNAAR